MLLRNEDLTIHSAQELVTEYRKVAPERTKKYSFCHVEAFHRFPRIEKDSRPYIVIPAIRSIHSIHYKGQGLLAQKLSCLQCCTFAGLCDACSRLKITVKEEKIQRCLAKFPVAEVEAEIEEDDDLPSDYEFDTDNEGGEDSGGGSDDGGTSDSDCDATEGDEPKEEFPIGCVVWAARYRKRIPAIVCGIDDIPQERKRVLRTKRIDMCYIQYLGSDNFSVVSKSQLLRLAANPIDMQLKKNTTVDIYQMALDMST